MNGPLFRRACVRRLCILVITGLSLPAFARSDGGDVDARQAQRESRDATIWTNEREAIEHERVFVRLWDALRGGADDHVTLGDVELTSIGLGTPGDPVPLGADVSARSMGAPYRTLTAEAWREQLATWYAAGWRLEQSEWHHARFIPATDDEAAQSTFSIVLHASHTQRPDRVDITGRIDIVWRRGMPQPTIDRVDATDLRLRSFARDTQVFQPIFETRLEHTAPADDILAIDIDGDGDTDLAYPPSNVLLLNDGRGDFDRHDLCRYPTTIVYEAAIADFTGDARLDLLVAGANPPSGSAPSGFAMYLYEGDATGNFAQAPSRAIDAIDLKEPETFAIGDIDADGDLDVFIAQYLQPYIGGQFPKPYFDANDGLPAYLLLNDGDGTFTDATESSGLAAKRNRRTFRASFCDLDNDRDLDLAVISDFAGLDLYANDGHGVFTDVSAAWVDEASSFGMSHTFGDFDNDGRIDLYVTGMASTTARRLHQLDAGRPDLPAYNDARMRIAYGNRLYLHQGSGQFRQPPYGDDVARSGWAWGCTSLDFDLNGHADIYVTNGNLSGSSSEDYCTRFWCHDIYEGTDGFDATQAQVFALDTKGLNTGAISWNGYEKNRLFMNRGGGFENVAWQMGVAIEEDCRAAIADDFDLDGRPDLAVISLDRRYRFPRRILRVYRNTWQSDRHFTGVRLRGAPGISPLGAMITVETSDGVKRTDVVVSGDSAKSQHSRLRHFGLGTADSIRSIEVRWPGGTTSRLENPAIDTYHEIRAPGS